MPRPTADLSPLPRPGARPRSAMPAPADEVQVSGAEAQLALCEPDHLRRLEQPLKYGFADRSSARKGLEVAAGVAIADRLGSIRQTAGPPIGRHGYMAIVWLGSRWLQLEHAGGLGGALHPVPTPARLRLGGVGQERPPGPEAHPAQPPGGALGGRGQRLRSPARKTHEDHFGIIDRVLWPVVHDGRLERLGYIFLGSWFLEQLRHEAGVYIDWDVLRDLPPSPASSTACSRTTASRRATRARSGRPTGWARPSSRASAPPAPASATTSRPSRGPARRSPATRAPATASRASAWPSTSGWGQQLLVWRPAGSAGRRAPRGLARAAQA